MAKRGKNNNFQLSRICFYSLRYYTVLENYIIEMTVFKNTLRPILIFSQFLGLINISYTLEPTTGLLLRYKDSTIYSLLELVRTCVLVMCTYIICAWELLYFFEIILLLKFWFVIIAARLSEKWIIKYDNIMYSYCTVNIYLKI
jgi:hypothetical protein